jgi:hypothetical protein
MFGFARGVSPGRNRAAKRLCVKKLLWTRSSQSVPFKKNFNKFVYSYFIITIPLLSTACKGEITRNIAVRVAV